MADEKLCPQCGRTYGSDDRFCTVDGATLVSSGNSGSLIGSVLAERYLVSERLGEGGMGEVYLAEHVRMKRKVAVKIMRRWMAGDPVAVSRFHREAENASQITHPNVAQVYDFGETSDGTIYLAMEFVPGEPLSAILEREGRLNAVRSAEVVRQTADALVAAHGMGILHRDLKPDNVMIARTRAGTDVVKLVDFGIARVMSRGTQQFTSTGMIVGTPEYMSPEQLANDTLDERSDLYALGLIAFRCLTGHGAFPEGSTGDALIARLTNRSRKLADVLPGAPWPEAMQRAFDRVLAANPADRYVDALEFYAELEGAVSQMPLTDDEQAYLVALSQRMATPARLSAIDMLTPVRAMNASGVNTPPMPQRSIALRTPPSEQIPPASRQTAPFTPPAGAPSFGDGGNTGESEPPDIDALRRETEVGEAAGVAAGGSRTSTPARPQPAVATGAVSGDSQEPGEAAPPSAGPQEETARDAVAAALAGRPATGAAVIGNTGSRRRSLLLAGGVLGVALIALAANMMRTPAPAVSEAPPAPQPLAAADSLAAATPPAVPETDSLAADSAGALAEGSAAADSQRIARARTGVLLASSSAGASTAAIVDAARGLLLTSASVVPANRRVDLFVDGDRTVRATVVHVDAASGVATLLASLKECRRCRALELAAAGSAVAPLAAGDSVVVMATARSGVQPLVRAVGAVGERSVTTTAAVPASGSGAPLILPRSGAIVALAARKGGSTTLVPAATLATVLQAAREASASAVPNDTVAWAWPARRVPQRVLDEGGKLAESAIAPYKVTQGGFTVFAVTPQVLAWRFARSGATAQESLNPFDIPGASTPKPADPAASWALWNRMHVDGRAVVILDISPEKASYPAVPTRLLEPKDADFFSMELKRDGVVLVPIESQRIPAVYNQGEYRSKRKQIPNAGLYAFHPMDFVPVTAQYTMEIADAGGRRVSVALPAAMLQAIARDLGGWQRR